MSKLHDSGELLPGSPNTQMSLPEGFPPTTRSKVPLPGYQRGAVKENSGLCTGPPVLGAEKSNPPTLGQPCLLVGSILELREVMEPYDLLLQWHAVLGGVAPLEGFPGGPDGDNHYWECPVSLC